MLPVVFCTCVWLPTFTLRELEGLLHEELPEQNSLDCDCGLSQIKGVCFKYGCPWLAAGGQALACTYIHHLIAMGHVSLVPSRIERDNNSSAYYASLHLYSSPQGLPSTVVYIADIVINRIAAIVLCPVASATGEEQACKFGTFSGDSSM
jgi:hypothetical protein